MPAEWKSGYYSGRLTAVLPDGKKATSELFFVVRSANPGKDTKILLQLSTNTYNAYSNWGGYSLYAYNGRDKVQGRRVSFDRPVAASSPAGSSRSSPWAEKNGYALDYAVNSDLEFHPELLKHYKLVLSVGHDEYWSAPMRDHLEKFIADGGNVAFFSGNTCCWQVRSEDNGRALACWKQAYKDDPLYRKGEHKLLSTLWSHHLVARPENPLTGVGFLYGGYHKSHGQFMDGSGAVHGPSARPLALRGHGPEARRRVRRQGHASSATSATAASWCGRTACPSRRTATARPRLRRPGDVPGEVAPRRLRVVRALGEGPRRQRRAGHVHAPGGGTVVTVGTTDWSHGLRGDDPAVERITRNVLDRLGK